MAALAALAPAQSTADPRDLAKGRFLVAVRDLPDPNFAETVVFLTDYGPKGAAGLVLTRPTKITIGDLFEGEKGTRTGDVVWRGGPVQRTGMMALVRTSDAPEGAKKVTGDAHVLTTREDLLEALDAPEGELKVFLGYSGWGAGQLEHEVGLGTWHIVNGDLDAVFATETGGLWERLVRRMEQRIARKNWLRSPRNEPNRPGSAFVDFGP